MRFGAIVLSISLGGITCLAQPGSEDAAFLEQAHAKYDSPFKRHLESFNCAVKFDWKRHFTEVVRLGDEGTDDEIARFIQPIRNRVIVTSHNASVATGLSEDQMMKLPRGGMAEGLLEHAVRFSLNNWLAASGDALLPPEGTPVHVENVASGYKLNVTIQDFEVVMLFKRDMSLQLEAVKGSAADSRETVFNPGPNGFLLSSFTQGEDGESRPGNRIISNFTYQSVGGFQLPDQVTLNRESHHEVWHYALTDCSVQTTK